MRDDRPADRASKRGKLEMDSGLRVPELLSRASQAPARGNRRERSKVSQLNLLRRSHG